MWGFLAVIIMIVVVIVAILISRESAKKTSKSSLDILKKRYAKGEITKKEFEQKKKDLE